MTDEPPEKPRRRPRYRGTHPRAFSEKYKELDAARYPEERAKTLLSGKTPAGSHVPVLVAEVTRHRETHHRGEAFGKKKMKSSHGWNTD